MALVTKEAIKAQPKAEGSVPDHPYNMPMPKDRYCFRIKDVTFAPSKNSGKPQLTFDCELYAPAKVTSHIDGREYNVAGREAKVYFGVTGDALGYLLGNDRGMGFMEKLGLKPEIDPENPNTEQFKGKTFSAIIEVKENVARKDLTPAQIENGQRLGDPIKDENGNEEKSYSMGINSFTIKQTSIPAPGSEF